MEIRPAPQSSRAHDFGPIQTKLAGDGASSAAMACAVVSWECGTAGAADATTFARWPARWVAPFGCLGSDCQEPFAHDIAMGPDGALWFTEIDGNKIGRITTAGVITEYPVPGPGHPYGITAGPDGAVWFTHSNQIGRITTAGIITLYGVVAVNRLYLLGITSAPDGALWFAGGNSHSFRANYNQRDDHSVTTPSHSRCECSLDRVV